MCACVCEGGGMQDGARVCACVSVCSGCLHEFELQGLLLVRRGYVHMRELPRALLHLSIP